MAPFIDDNVTHSQTTKQLLPTASKIDMTDPIAIVGMSCRFPGDADNVESLWKMCVESRDAWSTVPETRFNLNGYYHPDSNRPGATNVRGGHFLAEDPTHFDAPFFSITREEAAAMDPQQRLLLECSYEAFENAGITMRQLIGSDTSVFMGSFCRDWTDILNRDIEALPFYQATGTGQALLANRLSYFYDLRGPSVSIDTACSSSLVAVHLACQSLRTGESRQAIVGGSNVMLSHETMIAMSRMRFLSPDGRCYTYDHRANGYSRGEGAACIVLKPLAEALKDGDTIRGIIRNTGTNQDGKTNGITLPNSKAQEALMREVYSGAGLDPLTTSYVEAHGTGTPAGDPLEAAALATVFGSGRPSSQPLLVGSIKTNIGHLEGASGLAGIIKTVLMMEHRLVLPNLNFERASESIPLQEWKLKVPTRVQPWPTHGLLRASVCNYGYGGSNAHIIIDEASEYLASRSLTGFYQTDLLTSKPSRLPRKPSGCALENRQAYVFALSAFNAPSGEAQAKRLAVYLSERCNVASEELLRNLAFTLGERRSALSFKAAVSASSTDELIGMLRSSDIKYTKGTCPPVLGFVFTGQGAQWHAMGRELIATYPIFRNSLTIASKYIKSLGAPWSLLDELFKAAEDSQVGLGHLSQPLCTAVQIALVDLLASWNVKPTSVTGHSSGEIAAAYAAGALSQESAIAVAYYRGLAGAAIKQKFPHRKGSMLAVGMSEQETQKLLSSLRRGTAVVACINSPSSVTVSGDDSAVLELLEILEEKNIFARKLNVEVAYHSHHMNCVENDYLAALQRIRVRNYTKALFYSSVSGERMDCGELGPRYWVNNMVSPVKFSQSLRSLCLDRSSERCGHDFTSAVDILVEIGPHSALAGPIRQILQADSMLNTSTITYIAALVRNKSAVESSLQLAAQLFCNGCPVDFTAINNPERQPRQNLVDLPTYAWNHSVSIQAESRESRHYRARSTPRSDLLGAYVRNSLSLEPRWRNYIRPGENPWIRDHKIQSDMVYPAGGFIAMAIEAACQHGQLTDGEISGYKLREITIRHALVIPEDGVETVLCLRPCTKICQASLEIWNEFSIFSVGKLEIWTEHCRGLISVVQQNAENEVDGRRLACEEKILYTKMIAEHKLACSKDVDVQKLYHDLRTAGLDYGPTFANIIDARAASYRSVGRVLVSDTASVMPSNFEYPYLVHPSTLDGCIQVLFPGIAEAEGPIREATMPTFIEEVFVSRNVSREPNHQIKVYAQSKKISTRQSTSSIFVFDRGINELEPVITFSGLTCSSLPRPFTEDKPEGPKSLCFKTVWKPSPDFLSMPNMVHLYRATQFCGRHSDAFAYIDCLANKDPFLKCLQIESIGIEATCEILQVLGGAKGGTPRFSSYELAQVSKDDLEQVMAKRTTWAETIIFKVIDAETDLHEQGFEPESYDLVIASDTISGSKPLRNISRSIRRLMKPDGRILLLGAGQKAGTSNVTKAIKKEIRDFVHESGLEIIIENNATSEERQDGITILKTNPNDTPTSFEVSIVASERSSDVSLNHLNTLLTRLGAIVSITTLSDVQSCGKICIVLDESAQSILKAPSLLQFSSMQRIFSESASVLWITQGATLESNSPNANLVAGLARTLSLEGSSTIVTLDLDTQTPLGPEVRAQTVADVFQRAFISDCNGKAPDVEFSERNGRIMIPRIVEDKEFNMFVSLRTQGLVPEYQLFSQNDRRLTVDFGNPGQPSSLRFVDDIRMDHELLADHVEIEIKGSGINAFDLTLAKSRGQSQGLGSECSGIISAIGKEVQVLKVGDRVVCHAQGTVCNYIRQPASSVQLLPDSISFELGAALPVAYTTAYYALFTVGNLCEGDNVLIHAAAGSVGHSCIQLCRMKGCKVLATVDSAEEKDYLMEEFKVPESHIFSIRGGAFAKAIIRATEDRGVDLIINSTSGETLRQAWDCIAPFGRFVDLGAKDMVLSARIGIGKIAQNITLAAVDFDELRSVRPERVDKEFVRVMSLIRKGVIKPRQRLVTFGVADIQAALQKAQADKHINKVIVIPRPDEIVQVVPKDTRNTLLNPESSYLLVGGLGGLGRAIATWMVHCGAKNLVFASRSGLSKQTARNFVYDLRSKGINVAVFACDISQLDQLDNMLAQSAKTMPPINGVIQAAMVIKNSFFQNMSLEDYTKSLKPKVQGTWNLHARLPSLAFFILLSSAVGTLGNASQAAYAAASTFQDAFAAHRTCLGLSTTALDLGMISSVGYVAENTTVQRELEKQGFEAVTEAELLAMLETAIRTPRRTAESSSIISGLGTYRHCDSRPALAGPRFSHFRRRGMHLTRHDDTAQNNNSAAYSATERLRQDLRHAASREKAVEVICAAILDEMARLLMVSRKELSPRKAMAEQGLDSLVAVQMRPWVLAAMGAPVSVLELLGNMSVQALADVVVERSKLVGKER